MAGSSDSSPPASRSTACRDTEFFINHLLLRIHFIIDMILVDHPCAMGVFVFKVALYLPYILLEAQRESYQPGRTTFCLGRRGERAKERGREASESEVREKQQVTSPWTSTLVGGDDLFPRVLLR